MKKKSNGARIFFAVIAVFLLCVAMEQTDFTRVIERCEPPLFARYVKTYEYYNLADARLEVDVYYGIGYRIEGTRYPEDDRPFAYELYMFGNKTHSWI